MSLRMLSYILGSIIGTGVLTLPTITLGYSLINVLLSLCLCSSAIIGLGLLFSKTSNPFDVIKEYTPNFLYNIVGVGYWILSWTSTILITYEMSNEILILIGIGISRIKIIVCQLIIVLLFIGIQRLGMNKVNKVEIVITGLKILFVTIIPIILIIHGFKGGYTIDFSNINFNSILSMIPQMIWMYLGIESCSIMSNNNENKKHKITLTILSSILIIFLVYSLNIIGVMSSMDSSINLSSPYPQLVSKSLNMSGGITRSILSCVIITLCAGSTHSWYVMSAKTFQSLTNVFPQKYTSNYFIAVVLSSIGLIPLSIIVSSPNVKVVFSNLLDFFCIISSLFYFISSYSLTKKYKSYYLGIPVTLLFGSLLFLSCWKGSINLYEMIG